MLEIVIPSIELFKEDTNEIITTKSVRLQLEHSLVSLSKWESKTNKPFLKTENLTKEETLEYIKAMTITQNIDSEVYKYIPSEVISDIFTYIDATMTATTIKEDKTGRINRQIITSELIYYWMIEFKIPIECQRWHLNRLLTLIQICNINAQPKKKVSRGDVLKNNKALNEARKKQLNTSG